MHSTPWMHNDMGKKHSFYKRSAEEEAQLGQTMGSLQWGSAGAGRSIMSPPPAGSKHGFIIDDGNKKHLLLSQIKENRRSMSNMSKQIQGKK